MGFEKFSGFFGDSEAKKKKQEEGRQNETPNTGERGGLDTKNKASEYKDIVDEELADKELLELFKDKAVKKIRTDIEGEEAPVMYDYSPESIPDEDAEARVEPKEKYHNPVEEKVTLKGWGQNAEKVVEKKKTSEKEENEIEASYRKAV